MTFTDLEIIIISAQTLLLQWLASHKEEFECERRESLIDVFSDVGKSYKKPKTLLAINQKKINPLQGNGIELSEK